MSATVDEPKTGSGEDLADGLHQLEEHEAALERRTRSLEFAGPLSLVFSLMALAAAGGALAVALTHEHTGSSVRISAGGTAGGSAARVSMMGSTATSGRMMMGAGGRGKFTPAQVAAAKRGVVHVQLGDIWVAPTVSSVKAGKVVFRAHNIGKIEHELMVERMPMKFDAPMQPNEDAAQGMIPDMEGGGSGQMTMRLKPGTYMLFCNVQGHYAAGQHMVFTVTEA
jgi:uncharacterized cupredoxin-like copper-binding protein